ncbi:MAG: PQQ-dependent sugar dehydrogenase [Acidobacteriota bacterium]|nr:PQQ-dependent sugar dehydrogenase [Acidobacteriota bacterium]
MGFRWFCLGVFALGLTGGGIALPSAAETGEKQQFDSIFLRLVGEGSTVPTEPAGSGGGLTSLGDAVLLLTHEGKIFSARSARDIEGLAIETPDNGLAAYRRVAELERYQNFTFMFHWIRYNDILYYRSDSEHGLLLSYTEFNEENECYVNAIAALVLNPEIRSAEELSARREDWEVVYRTRPCLPLKEQWRAIEGHMAGGRIAFEAPATVYLASGDYHWDGIYAPEVIAQDPDKHYGKVMAIDLASRQARVVSIGHRNPQGIAIDRNGQLWVAEHGMRGGDELNRVIEGANYGWPEETLGTKYNRLPAPNTRSYGRHETFAAPTIAWLPGVAASNLTLIKGFHESWDGDLLMATLAGKSLFRIRVRDDRVVFAERIEIGKRIRYVHQHSDGRLVLWTDDKSLIFLTVAVQSFVTEFMDDYIANADYDDIQRNQIKVALGRCMECHSFEPRVHTNSPSLAAMFGASIGSTDYRGYSEALKGRDGRWSRADLAAFLEDPAAYAPGTTMPDSGIDDPFILEQLVNLLEAVGNTAE